MDTTLNPAALNGTAPSHGPLLERFENRLHEAVGAPVLVRVGTVFPHSYSCLYAKSVPTSAHVHRRNERIPLLSSAGCPMFQTSEELSPPVFFGSFFLCNLRPLLSR